MAAVEYCQIVVRHKHGRPNVDNHILVRWRMAKLYDDYLVFYMNIDNHVFNLHQFGYLRALVDLFHSFCARN